MMNSDPTATRQLEYPAGYKVVAVVVWSAYVEDDVATPKQRICAVMDLPPLSWSLDNLQLSAVSEDEQGLTLTRPESKRPWGGGLR